MTLAKTCVLALAGIAWAVSAQADSLYSEGFENLGASGWTLTNNSTPVGDPWHQGVPEIFTAQAGSGSSYASATFMSAADGGAISNWLISPEITLGSTSTLTFYLRTEPTAGFADTVKVYFNAGSSASTASFTSLLGTITAAQGWTLYSFALPDAATGRIAFQYAVGNTNDANVVGVDSVEINAQLVPEPATYALMGLGLAGLAVLRRRRAD